MEDCLGVHYINGGGGGFVLNCVPSVAMYTTYNKHG